VCQVLRGRVLRVTRRLVPFVMVTGLLGTGGAEAASALGSPLLLSITVSPSVASVAPGVTQRFTATGHYSDHRCAHHPVRGVAAFPTLLARAGDDTGIAKGTKEQSMDALTIGNADPGIPFSIVMQEKLPVVKAASARRR